MSGSGTPKTMEREISEGRYSVKYQFRSEPNHLAMRSWGRASTGADVTTFAPMAWLVTGRIEAQVGTPEMARRC
jgi:hypothetical protein